LQHKTMVSKLIESTDHCWFSKFLMYHYSPNPQLKTLFIKISRISLVDIMKI